MYFLSIKIILFWYIKYKALLQIFFLGVNAPLDIHSPYFFFMKIKIQIFSREIS